MSEIEILLPEEVIVIAIPITLPMCDYCGEPVYPDEPTGPILNAIVHVECCFRMVAGSVGHQQKCCHCYGRIDMSEDGLSKREGARRSLEYFRRHS